MSETTGGQELRKAIKGTLYLYGIRGEQLGSLRPGSVADAVLALPEMAALIADAERGREIREWLSTADASRPVKPDTGMGFVRLVAKTDPEVRELIADATAWRTMEGRPGYRIPEYTEDDSNLLIDGDQS